MWRAFVSKSNLESVRRLKLTRISLKQGTNFTDADWKGARGGSSPVAVDDLLSGPAGSLLAGPFLAATGIRRHPGPHMNSWVNFYQRLAREARERAAQATSPSVRAAFEQAAVEWLELAEWAERQDRKPAA